ncbi:extracellular solute-binding protein [Sulfitobacter sp.]|uniref:extracellular solute-binding protein n=1 Tax=Sulfitobacter sp. TaxID=1903071 RepID=UPI003001892B
MPPRAKRRSARIRDHGHRPLSGRHRRSSVQPYAGCLQIRRGRARRLGAITQWILERKENFGAFWNNATEASSAFTEAGAIIGQTWDTTGLLLNRDNPDFLYRAPEEGIITWLDSFGMLKQSENPEQAVAFMNFMLKPETGGMFSNNTGYNSAVAGAAEFASDEYKKQFNEVYTAEALGNMWWWQADTPFFAPVCNEFVEIMTNT